MESNSESSSSDEEESNSEPSSSDEENTGAFIRNVQARSSIAEKIKKWDQLIQRQQPSHPVNRKVPRRTPRILKPGGIKNATKENEIQGTNNEQKTEEHLMKKNIKYKKGNEILPVKKINDSLEKGSRDETIDPTSELRRLRKENDDIKKEIINKDAIIQIFQNDSKMKENMRLHRNNDIMRREIQDLREKTDERKSEVQNLQQQVREEQKRATYQIRRIQQEKENEIQQLREKNIKKNNENRQLREENIKTDNEIRELRQENADIIEDFISTIFADSKSVVVSNEKLGTGAWGTVYTGDFYGTTVAVKKFHQIILSPHNKKIIQREIEIASQCRHPNLLQFICATENYQHHLLIVTERMDMTLRTLLEQRAREKSRLEYQEIKSISLDVACGLNYLHSKTPKPIIHRDISSANVLLFIKNGEVRRAKISDYGSANIMQACNTPNPGAAIYAAPEARQAQQDPKIDVFSYGLLVLETSTCQLPQKERMDQINTMQNDGIKELVRCCTEYNPQRRPTMQNVIRFWKNMGQ